MGDLWPEELDRVQVHIPVLLFKSWMILDDIFNQTTVFFIHNFPLLFLVGGLTNWHVFSYHVEFFFATVIFPFC